MGSMISCITTTYQRPKELERAIKSVDAQTHEDWEHVIVYDGKADEETLAVIKKYQRPNRKFIELEKNYGHHAHPKNVGVMQSKGEYICYLDDDNEYLPNFMGTLLTELQFNQWDVTYGQMRMFKSRRDKQGTLAISLPFNGQFLLRRSFIDTNMALHTRAIIEEVGGWDESLPRFADWNLFVRMAKAGARIRQVPIFLTKYYLSKKNSAERFPVKSWTDEETGILMFDPTWWNPSSCYIQLPYLGKKHPEPKVAIFMLTKDRLEYTKRTIKSLKSSTKYPFSLYVFDNGSADDTKLYLETLRDREELYWLHLSDDNKGISEASNQCLDQMAKGNIERVAPNDFQHNQYDIIIKLDNDVEFLTKNWLEDFVDLWKRNRKLYLGPYPEGLVDHPGGSLRAGHATIGDEYVEITMHISGLCAFIDAKAYDVFRWSDKFLHGQQDSEASQAFVKQGYMPCIVPRHRIQHMNTRVGQEKDYPDYFKKRIKEKQTQYEPDKEVAGA